MYITLEKDGLPKPPLPPLRRSLPTRLVQGRRAVGRREEAAVTAHSAALRSCRT